jgi:hypothetical protein
VITTQYEGRGRKRRPCIMKFAPASWITGVRHDSQPQMNLLHVSFMLATCSGIGRGTA